MSVSAGYLTKIRYAVRRNSGNASLDAELTDIIEECRLDLQGVGVVPSMTASETDSLILGAVRCYARWKFGLSNEDAEQNKNDYMQLRDELRRRRDYMSYTITFNCKYDSSNVADVYVTFNGETKQTDSSGNAVFYYIESGVNQAYVVEADGYITQESYLDVTSTAKVNIVLVEG